MKKLITLLFSAVLLLSMPVMAAEVDQSRIVNIDASKSIIALGADLSAEQRATVLSLMDVTEADLANYQVVTITNDMEHQYLDAYMDASVIGSKSLSSVKITPAESGHGVLVTTKNINYCTTGMYRNALLTAGVPRCFAHPECGCGYSGRRSDGNFRNRSTDRSDQGL